MFASPITTLLHIFAERYVKKGAKMEWISVKDKKPIEGDMVLIFGLGKLSCKPQIRQGFLSKMDNTIYCDFMSGVLGGESTLNVTHWMSLPDPPPLSHNNDHEKPIEKTEVKHLLEKLNWSVYKFWKKSGIGRSTAYKIANEELENSALVKLAKLWLAEKVKTEILEGEG